MRGKKGKKADPLQNEKIDGYTYLKRLRILGKMSFDDVVVYKSMMPFPLRDDVMRVVQEVHSPIKDPGKSEVAKKKSFSIKEYIERKLGTRPKDQLFNDLMVKRIDEGSAQAESTKQLLYRREAEQLKREHLRRSKQRLTCKFHDC